MPQSREILVLSGRLDRAGRYIPRRSRSTPHVREWPVIADNPFTVVAELLDSANRVLHREPAQVKPVIGCQPGDPQSFRVLAYIELRDDAAAVRLMRDDLELWRSPIPPAPTLDVKLSSVRGARDKPVVLRLRYSKPFEGAHVSVVYKWGERRFRTIYIGPPAAQVEVDLRAMPGGQECLRVVSYSNGLRSAHAATEPFRVPSLPPRVTVIRPDARTPLIAGTPIILEGASFDPERAGGASPEDLAWLIDGNRVASGLIASIDGLPAGRHRVTLSYGADPGAESSTTITVRESAEPIADAWPEWDPIDGNN
ncbi:MAG TPA: hypothetical protein VF159_13335 [Gemmatimonadaceae bacterium]